jgi:hypothetical protein
MESNKRHSGVHMRKQRGVTMIGWIFLLTPVAIVLYAGIRVTPEYMNYYKVVQALKETANQLKSDEAMSQQSIQGAIGRRFETGYVDNVSVKDIAIRKVDTGWEMEADYESIVPLFGNLSLLMAFKTTVPIN